jgi:hypothetical protein
MGLSEFGAVRSWCSFDLRRKGKSSKRSGGMRKHPTATLPTTHLVKGALDRSDSAIKTKNANYESDDGEGY